MNFFRTTPHRSGVLLAALAIAAAAAFTVAAPRAQAASPSAPVAVRGTDKALWVNDGSGWQSLGGELHSAPAWAIDEGGRVLYVVTGRERALWVRSATQTWQHLGAGLEYCLDTPAISISGTTLTAACTGSDRALWYAQATVSAGSLPQVGAWASLGGYLTTGPSIATVAGQTTFAVTGEHQSVWFRTITTGYTGTTWACIGHPALANEGTHAYFACHGQDGAAWYSQNGGADWSIAQSAGGRLLGGVSLVAMPGGADMYVEGVDHQVFASHIAVNGVASAYTATGGYVNHGGVGGVEAISCSRSHGGQRCR